MSNLTCSSCGRTYYDLTVHNRACTGTTILSRNDEPVVGFTNRGGDMNCFLNSALQAICNLKTVRDSFIGWTPSCRRCGTCLSCLTIEICEQHRTLESQRGGTVRVENLRKELARVYKSMQMFELYDFADSAEALQAVLAACHSNAIGDATQGLDPEASNKKCSPLCPAHQTFSMLISEKLICACGTEGPVTEWDRGTFFLTYYVTELEALKQGGNSQLLRATQDNELLQHKDNSEVLPILGKLTEGLKRSMVSKSSIERCADENKRCLKKQSLRHTKLWNTPKIFTISLVWANSSPTKLETLKILASLPEKIDLSDIFEGVQPTSHCLKGMILFSSAHYISMFKTGSDQAWYRFDDEHVRKLPRNADKVELLNEILRSRQYPVVVFYEQQDSPQSQGPPLSDQDWLLLEKKMSVERSYLYGTPLRQTDTYVFSTKASDFFSKPDKSTGLGTSSIFSSLKSREDLTKPLDLPARGDPPPLTTLAETPSRREAKVSDTPTRKEYNPQLYKPSAQGVQGDQKPAYDLCKTCGTRLERGECPDCARHWLCKNGHRNSEDWNMCVRCYDVKATAKGWKCNECTSFNEERDVICKTCYKSKTLTARVLSCVHGESKATCVQCNRAAAAQPETLKCSYCGKLNPIGNKMCVTCYRSLPKESPPSFDIERTPVSKPSGSDSSRNLLTKVDTSSSKANSKEVFPSVFAESNSFKSPTKSYGIKSYELAENAKKDSTSKTKLTSQLYNPTPTMRPEPRQSSISGPERGSFTSSSSYFNKETVTKVTPTRVTRAFQARCAYCQRSLDTVSKICSGCGNIHQSPCNLCKTTHDAICVTCSTKCWKCSCSRLNKQDSNACSKCRAKKPSADPPPRSRGVSRPISGKSAAARSGSIAATRRIAYR
mmetsp:Transcript_30753/g.53835  ORF Transcript_30753/g.53835 Transcript_30753/m.53835 type:complete len:892 (-) Transcript_30753:20-2695(-)